MSTAYSTSGTTLTTTTSIWTSSTTCTGSATSTTSATASTDCTVSGTTSSAVSSSTSAPTNPYGLTINGYVDSACATQAFSTVVAIATLNSCVVDGTTSSKLTQSGSTLTVTLYSDTSCTTSTGTPTTYTTGTCAAISGTAGYQKVTFTEAPASSTATCFASSETVQLQDGSVKALRDVQIGDRVLTAAMDGSVKGYSPVIAVPHAGDVSTTASFVQLVTAEKDIKMTADHLVLAGSCDAGTPLSLVQAGSVTAGQCLQTTSGKAPVTAMRRNVPGQGLASVVTKAGGLVVVNGIAASPFAINHAIPEAWYSIHRLVYSVFPAALGFKLFQQTSERFGDLSLDFSL